MTTAIAVAIARDAANAIDTAGDRDAAKAIGTASARDCPRASDAASAIGSVGIRASVRGSVNRARSIVERRKRRPGGRARGIGGRGLTRLLRRGS